MQNKDLKLKIVYGYSDVFQPAWMSSGGLLSQLKKVTALNKA